VTRSTSVSDRCVGLRHRSDQRQTLVWRELGHDHARHARDHGGGGRGGPTTPPPPPPGGGIVCEQRTTVWARATHCARRRLWPARRAKREIRAPISAAAGAPGAGWTPGPVRPPCAGRPCRRLCVGHCVKRLRFFAAQPLFVHMVANGRSSQQAREWYGSHLSISTDDALNHTRAAQ
jgi:hypothetical protein